MAVEQKLYRELYILRDIFKTKGKRETGRAPLVCNDDALCAIAEMCPKRLSDLQGIPGIGKTFIDNYGEYFIEVVLKYSITSTERTVKISRTADETLRELEKKLVSINRRNRLLYMPKLANKYAYDLALDANIDPLNIIFSPNRTTFLCDLADRNELTSRRYKSLVSLLREVNKDLRDRGQNDLYIGYPFVIGRISGENFDVRCPLALFPVEVERTSTTISVRLDESRDALYNNTLILAYFKFNNITKPLPNDTIDELNRLEFIPQLLKYYEDYDIRIDMKQSGMNKFVEYQRSEFPHFKEGELYLEENVILGKFPVCSSSIQKDFDAMLDKGEINTLLNELLLEVNDLDYEDDSYYGEKDIKDIERDYQVSEKKLTYINDLDSSQETVLTAVNELDKLVIQGPPGTGKSQTITSLIAEFVNIDKTVLMVSEKKTALDVVYSRLGSLSKYALIIDDVGNKDLFYKQLSNMFFLGKDSNSFVENVNEIAEEIDTKIMSLELLASRLYTPDDFGIEPYKLYIQQKKVDFSSQEELTRLQVIHSIVNFELKNLKYNELFNIHKRFSNQDLLKRLDIFFKLKKQYYWLELVRRNLGELEILELKRELNDFKATYDDYKSKSFFVKLFTKGKIKRVASDFINKYFTGSHKELTQYLMNNFNQVNIGFDQYIEYENIHPFYEQLSNGELIYVQAMLEVSNLHTSLQDANDGFYNTMLYEHIMDFESKNKLLLNTIDNYINIIHELSGLIDKKKMLTRVRLEKVLGISMENITYAKRRGEIQRVIESKRKWSVNHFVSKFSFELFKGVKIWLLTPEVVSEVIPLETGVFDLVIFDEASQMYVEKGLPAIYRAKKVVIAGDHKQLRPSNLGSGRMEIDEEFLPEDEDVSAALEEESLLDLARFKYQDVMLNFHYRSRYEELIAFSNYAFYKGRLYVSPNVDKPEKPPIVFHKMSDATWVNRSNLVEAKYVVAMLKDILRDRKNEETIGIITFNSSQRDLIDDLIDNQCAVDIEFASAIRAEIARKKNGEDIGLFIKNIESVQGDERDIIIFSIGYAKNESGRLIRNFGWLNQRGGENRLNVAVSRAKQKVHIVASFNPEELQVEDTKNDGPRILKKYLQYAKAISDGDREAAQQILISFCDQVNPGEEVSFDSDFENQIYDALNYRLGPKGYKVDTQVGIGGYSIDLAIKKDNNYLLGIECDGRMYHSSKSARERDYHRQKYLESRGWRIHRIWSTNWWKNPKNEINKVCKVIETLG